MLPPSLPADLEALFRSEAAEIKALEKQRNEGNGLLAETEHGCQGLRTERDALMSRLQRSEDLRSESRQSRQPKSLDYWYSTVQH